MPQFTVTVSDDEFKTLEWDIYDVQKWIQNAISEKARRTMDTLIEQNSNLNPKKISKAEKQDIIRGLNLETAKERSDRFEKEMKEKPISK